MGLSFSLCPVPEPSPAHITEVDLDQLVVLAAGVRHQVVSVFIGEIGDVWGRKTNHAEQMVTDFTPHPLSALHRCLAVVRGSMECPEGIEPRQTKCPPHCTIAAVTKP